VSTTGPGCISNSSCLSSSSRAPYQVLTCRGCRHWSHQWHHNRWGVDPQGPADSGVTATAAQAWWLHIPIDRATLMRHQGWVCYCSCAHHWVWVSMHTCHAPRAVHLVTARHPVVPWWPSLSGPHHDGVQVLCSAQMASAVGLTGGLAGQLASTPLQIASAWQALVGFLNHKCTEQRQQLHPDVNILTSVGSWPHLACQTGRRCCCCSSHRVMAQAGHTCCWLVS